SHGHALRELILSHLAGTPFTSPPTTAHRKRLSQPALVSWCLCGELRPRIPRSGGASMNAMPAAKPTSHFVIQGREVRLPVVVRAACSGAATYVVAADAARRLIPDALELAQPWPGPVQHRRHPVPRQRPRRLQRGLDRLLRPRAR